jgi:aspartate dehydrogenase
MPVKRKIKIGIVGCGAIGQGVAIFIHRRLSRKAKVYALADCDQKKTRALKKKLGNAPRIYDLDALARNVDLIVEAASVQAAGPIVKKAISYRKDVVILSVGALIKDTSLLARSEKANINIYVPSGAICGVDGLGAISVGSIREIILITSKPPAGLMGARYFREKNIDLKGIRKATCVFKGTVKEAIAHFPRNINVAATLSLASSFKNIKVRIIADPSLRRNSHRIIATSRKADFDLEVKNVPSRLNPKTSALAILSTQYLLKKLFSSLKIGS